jgi:hypothetical protein
MRPYTKLLGENLQEVIDSLREIVEVRRNDIQDFDNLNNVFISGRRVGRIPSGATDVIDGDKVNDFNIADDSGTVYLYSLVNISGTAEWRRVALSSW